MATRALPGSGTPAAETAGTVLGPDAEFEGVLSFRGAVRIEGRLRGKVFAEGLLVVGPRAQLHAHLEVDELVLEGELEGDVDARERVEVAATGRLAGAIRTPALDVAEGAWIRARCAVSGRSSGRPGAAPPPLPIGGPRSIGSG